MFSRSVIFACISVYLVDSCRLFAALSSCFPNSRWICLSKKNANAIAKIPPQYRYSAVPEMLALLNAKIAMYDIPYRSQPSFLGIGPMFDWWRKNRKITNGKKIVRPAPRAPYWNRANCSSSLGMNLIERTAIEEAIIQMIGSLFPSISFFFRTV